MKTRLELNPEVSEGETDKYTKGAELENIK